MIYFLVGVIGLVTSIPGTAAGGAAALVIPFLMMLGLDPHNALGTTRAAAVALTTTAFLRFRKAGAIDTHVASRATIFAMVGAILGAVTITHLSDISTASLVFMVNSFLCWLVIFRKKRTDTSVSHRSQQNWLGDILFFLVGVWGGSVGGGYAILSHSVLLYVYRFNMLQSAAVNSVVGTGLSLMALPVYAYQGNIDWYLVPSLAIGNIIGAMIGSSLSIKMGNAGLTRIYQVLCFLALGLSGLKLWQIVSGV
jgi:uncharacterized protein